MNTLQLNLADGRKFAVVPMSAVQIEEIAKGKAPPELPKAKTFLQVDYGLGLQTLWLSDAYAHILKLFPRGRSSAWLQFTKTDGGKVSVPNQVLSYQEMAATRGSETEERLPACVELVVMLTPGKQDQEPQYSIRRVLETVAEVQAIIGEADKAMAPGATPGQQEGRNGGSKAQRRGTGEARSGGKPRAPATGPGSEKGGRGKAQAAKRPSPKR